MCISFWAASAWEKDEEMKTQLQNKNGNRETKWDTVRETEQQKKRKVRTGRQNKNPAQLDTNLMPGLHPKYHNIFGQSSAIICADLFSRWKAWMPPYGNSIDPKAWCGVRNVQPGGEPVYQLELCKANSSCLWNLLQPNRNKTSQAFQRKPVWSLVYRILFIGHIQSSCLFLQLGSLSSRGTH